MLLEQIHILFPGNMIENRLVRDRDHEVGNRKGSNEKARMRL